MGCRETISIELTPELTEAVEAAVGSGRFGSAQEVVIAALDQWQAGQLIYGYTPDELNALFEEGLNSGEPIDGSESFRRTRERFKREFGDIA